MFIGVQFHPEFRSRPNRPHPLFREFIKASLSYNLKTNQIQNNYFSSSKRI